MALFHFITVLGNRSPPAASREQGRGAVCQPIPAAELCCGIRNYIEDLFVLIVICSSYSRGQIRPLPSPYRFVCYCHSLPVSYLAALPPLILIDGIMCVGGSFMAISFISPSQLKMSSTPLAEAEEDVFDLTEAVPETERLDSSLQKAKAQLSIKTRRHRPSRTRLRDSVSSIDGDDSIDRMSFGSSAQTSSSPLHTSFRCSSPSSDLLLSSPSSRRDRTFTFDPCTVTDHLKSREGSQPLLHYGEYSQSEDDSHDTGPDEPDSPTVLLDKKTRRRFLDLGVTLRRTYGKVRKDRSNRLSAGNRDSERTENRSSRSSGPPFVPFSWFSERLRGSGSPKNTQSPSRPFTQGSSTDEDFDSSVGLLEDCRPCKTESSQPYQTLPEHSDGNDCDSSRGTDFSFKKKMLSAAGKDRTERQNGVHGKRDTGLFCVSKTDRMVNLKQAILQAWKERWSDYQWAINIKKNCPKGATWDYLNLAEALLEQAMIGPSPNPLILSYLKYAINSQMVSYSSVLTAISKFDDFSRELCIKSLLEIMDMFFNRLSCHGKAEECIGLCRAMLCTVVWLLQGCAWYCERLRESGALPALENSLRACLERMTNLLHSTKNRALVHIARLEEQASWTNVEQALLKLSENLNAVTNQTLKENLEECVSLVKSIPQMLCPQSDPPVHTSFPSVHAFIMLEGTMNLTGETQPLVEQLMMIKRMQRIPAPLFVLEIWKACFTGLTESPEGNEELKWTAFTFLKIPQVLLRLKKYPQGEKTQDFMEDVNVAFEYLLNLTPLLDKADQRCNCDCLSLLLQECNKLGLLSEANTANLTAKRSEDREHAPRLKTAENANIQPNPGLILRAEPTVTNILKTVDADHSKSPEGLLGVLGHMLSGKSLDLLLAAAAATGKLKSFARKFIKLNEFPKHISGEGSKSASVRALLFDISFLMLCHVVQTYGSEVILSDPSPSGETPFFETWLQTCMPEEGKTLNPDHPCFRT
ncbi:hypothetical protein QQF64_004411 [Cirrhinus molitorella]|uniref:Mediator of RNA polymerase II transcription subunit 24 n=1 Tax=Cirrhinus molitorella TaxID=172907 RepID=A0ABR3MI85_9TELE